MQAYPFFWRGYLFERNESEGSESIIELQFLNCRIISNKAGDQLIGKGISSDGDFEINSGYAVND
jgi:hypothetical protein